MEMKLMQTLTWKLHPITPVHWTNWYIQMWDLYSEKCLNTYSPEFDFSFKKSN